MKYILPALIAMTLFACKNFNRNNSLTISTEALDTIKSTPGGGVAAPLIFESALIKGTTARLNTSEIKADNPNSSLYGVTIGKITIVSGHIIACDPLHTDEYGIPFTQNFPAGEFPVQLSIATLDNEEMIAFAWLRFSEENVVRWELALQDGQKPLPVGDENFHGYGVDGGIGIFVDEEVKKELDKNKIIDDELYGPLNKQMDKHYHNTWRYAMYGFGKYNLAAFTTGLGDGHYATYIGFDVSGKPCRLITDFGFFDWRKKPGLETTYHFVQDYFSPDLWFCHGFKRDLYIYL